MVAIHRGCQNTNSIDIRSIHNLQTIKNFEVKGLFYEFLETKEYYLFGCDDETVITDHQFNKLMEIEETKNVAGLQKINERLVLISVDEGLLYILDLNNFEITFTIDISDEAPAICSM